MYAVSQPRSQQRVQRARWVNPRIQEEVVDDENFIKVMEPLKKFDPKKKNLVIACCISGRHPGVAVGELVTIGLDKLVSDGTDERSSEKVVLCNLSENEHWALARESAIGAA